MSRLQKMPSGQLFILLPKALAAGLGWDKGTPVQIKISGKNRLEVVGE